MLRSISTYFLQLFLYCKYVTYFSLFLISNFSFIYYVNNVVKHMEWERLDHVAILPYPFTLQNVRNSLRSGPTCFKPDFTCTFYAYLLYACNFIHMIYQNYKNHTHGSTWNYIFQIQDSMTILKWTIEKLNFPMRTTRVPHAMIQFRVPPPNLLLFFYNEGWWHLTVQVK